jgi:peroxiredoxin Q/BCP
MGLEIEFNPRGDSMATRKKKAKNKASKKVAKKKSAQSVKNKTTKKKTAKKVTRKKPKKTASKKKATKKTAAKKVTKKKAVKKATKKATKKKVTKKAAKKASKKKVAKVASKPGKKKVVKKTATKSGSDLKTYEPKVAIGKVVPNFKAEMTGDQVFDLSEQKGKTVVLYFYPKDSTPGCTVEGLDFTKLHNDFKNSGAEVFGVSRDSLKSHESFKSKQSYSFDLISDAEEKMCAIFGTIKLKNMYGKMVRGIDRSTFVIGTDGKLLKEWRKVKVPNHAEEVLQFVKTL